MSGVDFKLPPDGFLLTFKCTLTSYAGRHTANLASLTVANQPGFATSCLFVRLQELTYKRRKFVCPGIKSEVSCVEYMHLSARNILAVSFRLAGIE